MHINRRGLLLGLGSALAAPAIVHIGNLMPINPSLRFDFLGLAVLKREGIPTPFDCLTIAMGTWYVGINQRAKYRWVAA